MLLSIILAITLTQQSKESDCWIDNGLDKAPSNTKPRIDLPPTSNHEGGVLIPIETSQYISTKMRCLWQWESVCNNIIDANKQIHDARVKDLTEQIERLKKIEPDKPDRWWLWTAIGIVTGSLVGLSVGVLVAK